MNNSFKNAAVVGIGVDPAEYHKQDSKRGDPRYVMSRSELMLFSSSPSRWIHGYRFEDTDATEWGDLMDCLVTDPDRFGLKFCVKPETYINEKNETKPWSGNSNVCKEWLASQAGKTPLKLEDKREADKAVERLYKDAEIYEFLSCSDCQVMVTADYHDAATGVVVPVKILPDLVPDKDHDRFGKCLCNFKTARNGSPDKWEDEIRKRHYHTSAAMELDVYSAGRPEEDRCEYRHIISESVFPFEPGRRWLETELIETGRTIYRTALANYALCLKQNRWPGWDDGEGGLIPGWTQMKLTAWMVKDIPAALTAFSQAESETSKPDNYDQGIVP